jgi:catalase
VHGRARCERGIPLTIDQSQSGTDTPINEIWADDGLGQAGTLVRSVFNEAQRDKLVEQVASSLLGGVRSPVLERAFGYWKSVDAEVGRRIEEIVASGG